MASTDHTVTCPDTVTPPAMAPDNGRIQTGLATAAAAASVLLTAAAFWLSYQHLHDVADSHGLHTSTARAWAWPVTVDLFIIIGELLILRASLTRRVDPWAISLTIAGSGGSIALNVAGVGPDAQPLDYVVAAVPPVAALLAFGALMRQIHEYLTARIADTVTPDSAPAEAPAVTVAADDDQPTPAETPDTDGDETPERAVYDNPIEAAIRALYDTLDARPVTSQMTAAMTAAGLGDSPSTARAARARIEAREPHLRDLPTALTA